MHAACKLLLGFLAEGGTGNSEGHVAMEHSRDYLALKQGGEKQAAKRTPQSSLRGPLARACPIEILRLPLPRLARLEKTRHRMGESACKVAGHTTSSFASYELIVGTN